ncbi:MAG: hypothetical protein JWP11_2216 [Frankiales bacterium]|nr:hypothetical protein [Frankiales bacterium]
MSTPRPSDPLEHLAQAQAVRERSRALQSLITTGDVRRMSDLAAEDPALTPLQLVTEALDPDRAPSPLLRTTEDAVFALHIAFSVLPSDSLYAALERAGAL